MKKIYLIKTIFRYAMDNGWIKINPFNGIKVDKGIPNVEFLSPEELIRITQLDLTEYERLERVRDLLLFQASIGTAYCDLVNFDANFNELDASYLDNQHVSKDIVRLTHDIDSVNVVRDSLRTNLSIQMREEKLYANSFAEVDTVNELKVDKVYDIDTLFAGTTYRQAKNIMNNAVSRINTVSNDIQYSKTVISDSDWYFTKHSLEWHRKFTLSFACLIFFFIGAPLGAIIRKGGLGMPAVVAVLMFIVYYIIDTMGVKMAREAVWEVWQGMWLSSGVLLPIGIFLTYKAATDSTLFNIDGLSSPVQIRRKEDMWRFRLLHCQLVDMVQ